jgi:hypothetical protein
MVGSEEWVDSRINSARKYRQALIRVHVCDTLIGMVQKAAGD